MYLSIMAGIYAGKGLEDVTVGDMVKSFSTNTTGPLIVTQSLLPLLRRAACCSLSQPLGWQRAAVINVSGALGSILANEIAR